MLMKNLIAATILSMAAASAALACSESSPTHWVRVQFAPGCSVPDEISIHMGTKMRIVSKKDGYYTADFGDERYNASDPLTVDLPAGLTFCCHAVTEVRHPTNRRDCTIDFIVSCDKPNWGVIATTDSPTIGFAYFREHFLGADSVLCQREVEPTSRGITGVGDADTVIVKVKDGDRPLVAIPVTLANLKAHKGKLPFDQEALKACLPIGKSARPGTTNEEEFIDSTVSKLPKNVTVTEIK